MDESYSDSRLSDPWNIRVRKCLMDLFQAVGGLVAFADLQEGNALLFLNFWPAVSSPMARKFPLYSTLLQITLDLLRE